MKRKILSVFALLTILALTTAVAAQTEQVILVSDNAADSGVAEILSEKIGAEVVYTEWGTFSEYALDELENISPEKAVIVGGNVAVPSEAETQLEELGIETERLAGKNRYETSAMVAEKGWGADGSKNAMVAQGYDGSGIELAKQKAKQKGTPLLYATPNEVPEEIKERLRSMNTTGAEYIPAPDSNRTRIREQLREHVDEVNETERNMTEASQEAIDEAEQVIQEANETLPEFEMGKGVAAHNTYGNAAEHLNTAKEAFENEEYGKAYGQAISAKHLAKNSRRLSENNIVGNLQEEVQKAQDEIDENGLERVRERIENQYKINIKEKVQAGPMENETEEEPEENESEIGEETSGNAQDIADESKGAGQNE
ncbi:MAG: hypothetical protein R6U26_00025 [Candidatus Undinarchaeales archaeon]